MASSSVIRVSILGDWSSLQKAMQESATSSEKWAGRMSSAGSKLTRSVTLPILAGAALATKAAADEQAEMENLANTIRNNIPNATDAAIKANEEWITSMQNATGIADGELRAGLNNLVISGMDLEEAQKNLAIAMDISVAKGKPLAAVTEAMAKANQGNIGALGRLGIATKNARGETLTFEQVMARAADTMGGAAATAADTAAGRAAITQAKMADLAETIGSLLLPVMDKLTSLVGGVADWFNELSPAGQQIAVTLAGIAAAIGPVLIVGAKLVQAFQTIMTAFRALSVLMMSNPWLLLIAAVIALVVLIITNWDKIKAYLKAAWEWIRNTAKAVWDGIKAAIKAAADWLLNLFLNWTLPGLIIKHWDKIKAGVVALKEWLVNTWNGIIDWFRKLPERIGNAVKGMWDGIRNGFKAAINWIIDKWNGFRLEVKIPSNALTSALGIAGKGFSINTPNIPRLHDGGVFRAPGGTREGLAMLRDGETVLPAGASSSQLVINLEVHAGIGTDANEVSRAIVDHLQRYARVNGPIPIPTRAG